MGVKAPGPTEEDTNRGKRTLEIVKIFSRSTKFPPKAIYKDV